MTDVMTCKKLLHFISNKIYFATQEFTQRQLIIGVTKDVIVKFVPWTSITIQTLLELKMESMLPTYMSKGLNRFSPSMIIAR